MYEICGRRGMSFIVFWFLEALVEVFDLLLERGWNLVEKGDYKTLFGYARQDLGCMLLTIGLFSQLEFQGNTLAGGALGRYHRV